jgi:hypothetical protein
MTGYDVYCYCRKLIGWNRPSIETYVASSEKQFFEMLRDYLVEDKKLLDDEIRSYINANYSKEGMTFDPYHLMNQESWDTYRKWKLTQSTVPLYFEEVKKTFDYITNVCINKNITLNEYKRLYACKHIREKIIDWSVAVHLQLIDKNKLSKVEKLLLKQFLKEYKLIEVRLSIKELNQLMEDLTFNMNRLLAEMIK